MRFSSAETSQPLYGQTLPSGTGIGYNWASFLLGAYDSASIGDTVNPQYRRSDEARRDDYVFQGYELADALEAANAALEDDARVSEQDGHDEKVKPFIRDELLRPLERWFFGR